MFKFFKISFTEKIIALVFMCLFFLISCNEIAPKKKNENNVSTSREEAKNVVIKYSVGGKRKSFLSGPIMYRVVDTTSYIEFPKTIHVDFYNEKDSIESILDAHYAKYKDNESIVFLKDSVRVMNMIGDTLYCDELYWNRARKGTEFYTDKPVRIRTKTHIIDGIGMESAEDFKNWHIIHPVGLIKVPSSDFPN